PPRRPKRPSGAGRRSPRGRSHVSRHGRPGSRRPPRGRARRDAMRVDVTTRVAAFATCLLLLLFAAPTRARTEADPALVAEIEKIKAIDNHAHPIRALNEGEEDREFDALIPDELEPAPLPLKLRPDNPEFVAAWRAFYGYAHDDMSEAH